MAVKIVQLTASVDFHILNCSTFYEYILWFYDVFLSYLHFWYEFSTLSILPVYQEYASEFTQKMVIKLSAMGEYAGTFYAHKFFKLAASFVEIWLQGLLWRTYKLYKHCRH